MSKRNRPQQPILVELEVTGRNGERHRVQMIRHRPQPQPPTWLLRPLKRGLFWEDSPQVEYVVLEDVILDLDKLAMALGLDLDTSLAARKIYLRDFARELAKNDNAHLKLVKARQPGGGGMSVEVRS